MDTTQDIKNKTIFVVKQSVDWPDRFCAAAYHYQINTRLPANCLVSAGGLCFRMSLLMGAQFLREADFDIAVGGADPRLEGPLPLSPRLSI